MEKSPDAFRTISEVADFLSIPAHVLRFWESRFPQIRPVKRAGGRRYYRPADVALLSGIRQLLHDEGMTIRGVQKILREKGVRHVAGLVDGSAALGPEDDDLLDDAMIDAEEEAIAAAAPSPPPQAEVIPFDSLTARAADEAPPQAAEAPLILSAQQTALPAGEDEGGRLQAELPLADTEGAEIPAPAHWPEDPEQEAALTPADPTMPPPWHLDPDAPQPRQDVHPAEPVEAAGGESVPQDALDQPEPTAVMLPDVPFEPRIAEVRLHIPTRLRAMSPADPGDRAAKLASLYTRLKALRQSLGQASGKNRN